MITLPISWLESPSFLMVSLVDWAIVTAFLATRAESLAFLAISRIEACISSVAVATDATFFETCSLAAETTLACTAVSSALPAICWLTAVSSSDEVANALAFSAVNLSGSTIAAKVWFHTIDDFAVVSLMLRGVGPDMQFAFRRRFGKHGCIGYERIDVSLQQRQPLVDLILIGRLGHRCGQVAIGNRGYESDQLGQPEVQRVNRILHLLVITLAGQFRPCLAGCRQRAV